MKLKHTKISPKPLLSAIETLLSEAGVGTQDEIRKALEHQGISINQSRISRLLRKLGAIKTVDNKGESIYVLPKEVPLSPKNDTLSQLIIEISANETQVVIHTNPGSASLIAGMLDHQRKALKILATIAGDDVLLVIPEAIAQTKALLKAIRAQFYEPSE